MYKASINRHRNLLYSDGRIDEIFISCVLSGDVRISLSLSPFAKLGTHDRTIESTFKQAFPPSPPSLICRCLTLFLSCHLPRKTLGKYTMTFRLLSRDILPVNLTRIRAFDLSLYMSFLHSPTPPAWNKRRRSLIKSPRVCISDVNSGFNIYGVWNVAGICMRVRMFKLGRTCRGSRKRTCDDDDNRRCVGGENGSGFFPNLRAVARASSPIYIYMLLSPDDDFTTVSFSAIWRATSVAGEERMSVPFLWEPFSEEEPRETFFSRTARESFSLLTRRKDSLFLQKKKKFTVACNNWRCN